MKAASYDTNLRNVGWSRLSNLNLSESVEITALGISVNPPNRLIVGTNNGHVYRIDDANTGDPVPLEITGENFPFDAYVGCIDIDPDDADRIFTVFSNYGVQSIFYSDDGGMTWTHVSGNLEQYPDGTGAGPSVRWVKTLNYNENTVYFAGTSIGLYSTTTLNGDETIWIHEGSETIGSVMVDMVDARESDGFVAIATQGNGLYSTYYDPSTSVDDAFLQEEMHVTCYPNPFQQEATIEFELNRPALVEISLLNLQGQAVMQVYRKNRPKGLSSAKITRDDLAPGIYFLRIRMGGAEKIEKVMAL